MSPSAATVEFVQAPAVPLVLEPARHSCWPRFLLTPGTHTVGIGANCQLSLAVEGLANRHAELIVERDQVQLRAFDPRTWVNDGPIRLCKLRLEDRITIGPCTWIVRRASTDDVLSGWPKSTPADSAELTANGAAGSEEERPSDASATTEARKFPASHATVTAFPAKLISDTEAVAVEPGQQNPFATLDAAQSLLQAAVEMSADVPTSPVATGATVHDSAGVNEVLRLHDELQILRQDLDRARTAWREETLRREIDLAAESTSLARRGAAIERGEHELERARRELSAHQQSLTAREADLAKFESELNELQQGLSAERQRLESFAVQTRRELEQEANRQSTAWNDWEATQQRLLRDLTEQTAALEDRRAQCQTEREELQQTRLEFEQARREFVQVQRTFEDDRTRWTREREEWEARCLSRDEAHAQSLAQVRRQQEQLAHELRERGQAQTEFLEAKQQLQHERRLFAEQQAAWIQEREALWNDLSERRGKLDRDSDDLESMRRQIEQLQESLERELDAARQQVRAAEQPVEEETASDTVAVTSSAPSLSAVEDSPSSAAAEVELTDDDGRSDLDAVQAALDALAARFEEFSEFEQRLTNKHDELRDLQQDLAVREAALETQSRAWREEHEAWQQEIAADVSRRRAEKAAWEAERQRWCDQFQQLQTLAREIPARSHIEPVASSTVPMPQEVEVTFIDHDAEADVAPEVDEISLSGDAFSYVPSGDVSVVDDLQSYNAQQFPTYDPSYDPAGVSIPEDTPDLVVQAREAAALNQYLAVQEVVDVDSSVGPAEFEKAEQVAEQPADSNLRAELARMFDLPEEFASRKPADLEETELPRIGDAEALDEVQAEATDEEPAQDDDNWRSRLTGLLEPSHESEEFPLASDAVSTDAAEAPVGSSLSESTVGGDEEDSVAAYMERLLARTRKSDVGSDVEGDDTRREVEPRSTVPTPSKSPPIVDESRAERSDPLEPRKSVDKEVTRAELQSFREVANRSARAALAKHSWETTRTEFGIQATLASLCAVSSTAYLSAPWWGNSIQWGPGFGCAVAGTFVGYRAWQTYDKLRQWKLSGDAERASEHTKATTNQPVEDCELDSATDVETSRSEVMGADPEEVVET